LERDVDAWVASAGKDQPWLVPLSFIWHDGNLVFAMSSSTRTARNVSSPAPVRVALGGTRDVVLVDGEARIAPSDDLSADELGLYRTKHGSDPRSWADTIIRVRPSRTQAWREENELEGRLIMRDGTWLR
ncbi:MAG: pyridoxamine 5'-phosphate oxidase family protein, partial [Micromonosporaceae bacterium]